MPVLSARSLISEAMDTLYFHPEEGEQPALVAKWIPGKTNLVVLLGNNATGKSFFRRLIGGLLQLKKKEGKKSAEFIPLSMEARAGSNFMGAAKAFVYGDESYRATGENSAHTVTIGIKTAMGRDSPHVLFWDEPDIGLSDEYAQDVGRRIAWFIKHTSANTRAVFVATHRRPLVAKLLEANPHVLLFGEDAPGSAEDWMTRQIWPVDLERLIEDSHSRFSRIQAVLNKKKEKARDD